jgi:hypothetical protein
VEVVAVEDTVVSSAMAAAAAAMAVEIATVVAAAVMEVVIAMLVTATMAAVIAMSATAAAAMVAAVGLSADGSQSSSSMRRAAMVEVLMGGQALYHPVGLVTVSGHPAFPGNNLNTWKTLAGEDLMRILRTAAWQRESLV